MSTPNSARGCVWAVVLCLGLAILVACAGPQRYRKPPRPVPWEGMNVPPPTPAQLMALLKDRLHLTASQEEAVSPIMDEHCTKRDLIMQRYADGGPAAYGYYKGATRALQQETETKLATVLTARQMTQYRAMEEERQNLKQKAGEGWGGGPRGRRPEGDMESMPFRSTRDHR